MSGSQTAEAALLAWYEAMGVDEAIGEMPLDCFAVPMPELPLVRPVPRPLPSSKLWSQRSRVAP